MTTHSNTSPAAAHGRPGSVRAMIGAPLVYLFIAQAPLYYLATLGCTRPAGLAPHAMALIGMTLLTIGMMDSSRSRKGAAADTDGLVRLIARGLYGLFLLLTAISWLLVTLHPPCAAA